MNKRVNFDYSAFIKLKRAIFFVLLFFLPTNLGLHFVESFAYVNGLLVDYLIPTLYVQDILIVVLFLLWVFERIFYKKYILQVRDCRFGWKSRFIAILVLSISLSVVSSMNVLASLFAYLRLLLYIIFSFYIVLEYDIKENWKSTIKIFTYQLILLGILAFFQWVNQGSVFDNYLFFGEQPYSFSTFGVAKESLNGKTVLPVYGTFRHPNVFGAYVSVLIGWIYYSTRYFSKNLFRFVMYIAIFFGFAIVLLTFSINALIASILGFFGLFAMQKYKGYGVLLCLFVLIFLILFSAFLPSISENYFNQSHSFYRRAALYTMVKENLPENFLFGVGYNASSSISQSYIKYYDAIKYPQPVHNIYLLILIDSGIFAFVSFCILFLSFIFSRLKDSASLFIYITFYQFVSLGLFDHFLITIHQTSLLLWLTIGFYFAYNCCNTGYKLDQK